MGGRLPRPNSFLAKVNGSGASETNCPGFAEAQVREVELLSRHAVGNEERGVQASQSLLSSKFVNPCTNGAQTLDLREAVRYP